jgi:hypothetical protein
MACIRQLTDVSRCKLQQYLPDISHLNLPAPVPVGVYQALRPASPRAVSAGTLPCEAERST